MFQLGALYNRVRDIHDRYGGQRQGGISTPAKHPFIFVFTGEAGKSHGYADYWDEADGTLHYFGEGQAGDMKMSGGNLAIENHLREGKRIFVFKSLGHGKPYRYDGEFVKQTSYVRPDTPATRGPNRNAIVFKLLPLDPAPLLKSGHVATGTPPENELGSTVVLRLSEARSKQQLFRRRLIDVEKQCRITKIMDLRFLRASHIKPWSVCATAAERTDGNNGLLLTPTADLLFDRGWISFDSKDGLLVSDDLPNDVRTQMGLKLANGRSCGRFNADQQRYLQFHQESVFRKGYLTAADPVSELLTQLGQ